VRKSSQEVPTGSSPRLRCYTRKSTEEGLEQEFNSLDAQREAAEPSFRVSGVKDGLHCRNSMTMADSPAPTWTDRLWRDCFRQSKRVNWIVWSCIKSTD